MNIKTRRRTVYRHQGYLMRSYAETRWAKIMDALGVNWLYEEKPVLTRYGLYLPDFLLPMSGLAVEVKGAGPTSEEIDKAEDASVKLNMPVVIAFGDPTVKGGAVTGAYVTAVYDKVRVSFALSELAELVLWNTEGDIWSRLMKACVKEKFNPVRHAGEVLDELFIGDSEEGFETKIIDSNKLRREMAAAENSRRVSEQQNQSIIEFGLSKFSRTVVSHTNRLRNENRS